MTEPWHGTGRSVVADSAFASWKTATAMLDHGLYFKGMVKTATIGFPSKYLNEIEFAQLGDSVTLATQYKGNLVYAHCWGDKIRKKFVCTDSTTLEGTPSNKRRWREMRDTDGNLLGQTGSYCKHILES